MIQEYKKVLSWKEIRKLNSWPELKDLSSSRQVYITLVCIFKAFGHWQVWVSLLLFITLAYFSHKVGEVFNLYYGIFNIFGLLGGGGASIIFSIAMSVEARKHLSEELKSVPPK